MKLFDVFKREKDLNCSEVLEVLQSYLDGETDTTTARHVSTHLAVCVNCEPESVVYRRIKSTIAVGGNQIDETVLSRLEVFTQRVSSGQIVASSELDG
jgi:hypothetical protein